MTKERALEYWINRYNSAKDYSDIHWDAEERHEHRDYIEAMAIAIKALEAADVQPLKSKWCPPLMGQGKCDTYCERCHGKIMRNSTGIFEETPYCPHCGADMRGDEK